MDLGKWGEFGWELDDLNELVAVWQEGKELFLWMLHPRKGCSQKLSFSDIEEKDLSGIRELLLKAQKRARDRLQWSLLF